MLNRMPNYISVSDFNAFADAVDAFNQTLSDGKRLNVFYIPLRRNSKVPATSKPMYTLDGNGNEIPRPGFAMDREAAAKFLEKNFGNIGILAYNDGVNPTLALFDFDIEKNPGDGIGKTIIPKETIAEFTRANELPVTITRQGGYHVYVVNDGSLSNANIIYNGKHAGELRCHKMYVVAPGSHVPKTSEDDTEKGKIPTPDATGTYRLLASRPLKTLSQAELPDWLGLDTSTGKTKRRIRPVEIKPITHVMSGGNDILNDIGVSLTIVRARDEPLDQALLTGAIETDRSKADYAIAWRLKAWGFDDSSIAHILRKYRASDKTNRDDYIELTISKVTRNYEYRPYIELRNDYERIRANAKKTEEHAAAQIRDRLKGTEEGSGEGDGYITDDGVHHLTTFPTTLPDEKYVHLRGLPRVGKSHWTLTQLAESDSGVYVTSNHDIIEQQFRTFHRLAPTKTAVWLKGKHRCCPRVGSDGRGMDCSNCKYRPRSEWDEEADLRRPTIEEVEIEVSSILQSSGYMCYIGEYTGGPIAPGDIETNTPPWVCPYFALQTAAKEADFIFTVPYYSTDETDATASRHRTLMVMDEDTVFKFYAPKTVSLLEYGHVGNITNFTVRSDISSVTRAFGIVVDTIAEKDRQSFEEKIILSIARRYTAIEGFITDVSTNNADAKRAPEVRAWLKDAIVGADVHNFGTLTYDDRLKVIRVLEEYQRTTGGVSEDSGIVEYAEALLFPHPHNPVYWENGNPATLYLIADESRIIRTPTEADKYLIVGFTEGEMFAEQMSRREFGPEWNDHVKKLHIERFPYGDNFTIFRVVGERPTAERRLFYRVVNAIEKADNEGTWKTTRLVLTASKRRQLAFDERSASDRSVKIQRKHGLDTIQMFGGLMGASMIFYSNSRISRGIDIPSIDMLIADSCAFAQPYISATVAAYRDILREMDYGGSGDVEPIKRALYDAISTKDSLLTDETTNGVLRIAPVIGHSEEQVKVIVIAGQDYRYVNHDATSRMHTVDVDDDCNIELVARIIDSLPRRVNPTNIMMNTGMTFSEFSERWGVVESGSNVPVPVESPGCIKTQLPDLLEEMTPEKLVDTEKAAIRSKMVELEGKIMDHPYFDENKRIKITSLKKWAYSRLSNSYSRTEINRAIKNLIGKKYLTIEIGKSGQSKSSREYQFVRRARVFDQKGADLPNLNSK